MEDRIAEGMERRGSEEASRCEDSYLAVSGTFLQRKMEEEEKKKKKKKKRVAVERWVLVVYTRTRSFLCDHTNC